MSKAIYGTGEEYSEAAFYDLGREKYKEAIHGALVAFALGTPSSAIVFCKYYHDKMLNGEVVGTTVPFLIMYNLAKNYRLEGYAKYTENADKAAKIMISKKGIIERDVAAFETHLYEAGQQYAGKKVTPEEGLRLVAGMKNIPLDVLPLQYAKTGATEATASTSLFQGMHISYDYKKLDSQDDVRPGGEPSFLSKICGCFGWGKGSEG